MTVYVYTVRQHYMIILRFEILYNADYGLDYMYAIQPREDVACVRANAAHAAHRAPASLRATVCGLGCHQ